VATGQQRTKSEGILIMIGGKENSDAVLERLLTPYIEQGLSREDAKLFLFQFIERLANTMLGTGRTEADDCHNSHYQDGH